jgi:hypothetical protein
MFISHRPLIAALVVALATFFPGFAHGGGRGGGSGGHAPSHSGGSPRTTPSGHGRSGSMPANHGKAPGHGKAPATPPVHGKGPATPPVHAKLPATPPGHGKTPATPPGHPGTGKTHPGQGGPKTVTVIRTKRDSGPSSSRGHHTRKHAPTHGRTRPSMNRAFRTWRRPAAHYLAPFFSSDLVDYFWQAADLFVPADDQATAALSPGDDDPNDDGSILEP